MTLFAVIEGEHYEALRRLSFERHESLAAIVREALGLYVVAQRAAGRLPERD